MPLYLQIHGIFAADPWSAPGDCRIWSEFDLDGGLRGRIPPSARRNAIDMGVDFGPGAGNRKTIRPGSRELAPLLEAGVPWEKAALVVMTINHALTSARQQPLPGADSLPEALARIRTSYPLPPPQERDEDLPAYKHRTRRWLSAQEGVDLAYLRSFRFLAFLWEIDNKRANALYAPYRTYVTRSDMNAIREQTERLIALYKESPERFDEVLEDFVRGNGLEAFSAKFDADEDFVIAARLVTAAAVESHDTPVIITPMLTTHRFQHRNGQTQPGDVEIFDDAPNQRRSRPGRLPAGHHGLNVFYQHATVNLETLIGALRRPERNLGGIVENFVKGFTEVRLPRFRHDTDPIPIHYRIEKIFLITEIADTEKTNLFHLFADPLPIGIDLFEREADCLLRAYLTKTRRALVRDVAYLTNSTALAGRISVPEYKTYRRWHTEPGDLTGWAAEQATKRLDWWIASRRSSGGLK